MERFLETFDEIFDLKGKVISSSAILQFMLLAMVPITGGTEYCWGGDVLVFQCLNEVQNPNSVVYYLAPARITEGDNGKKCAVYGLLFCFLLFCMYSRIGRQSGRCSIKLTITVMEELCG